ncbi:hypothetical protein B0H34DRAFT_674036 [Crassisporium funariophilum]|nr:hypothetical protein B0H34DRAFT_674036 [Crassisporium funariophilum]
MSKTLSNYKRIMMLIGSNEVEGLRRLIAASLWRGTSPAVIVLLIEQSLAGLYSPSGGFSKRNLDITLLVKSMGGPRLLYVLQKSHGLASLTTVHRNYKIPQLLASVGMPSKEEFDPNMTSFLDPAVKPAPPQTLLGAIPGIFFMFDALFEAPTKDKKVCFGSNATVVALALYTQSNHYRPVPLVVSASDKTEKGPKLSAWIRTLLDAYKAHKFEECTSGPIWALGSDGDSTFQAPVKPSA